jgi:hypothetical protein
MGVKYIETKCEGRCGVRTGLAAWVSGRGGDGRFESHKKRKKRESHEDVNEVPK